MSSSDKRTESLPDWDVFAQRTMPLGGVEMLSPAGELASVLQWARLEIDAARVRNRELREEGARALAQLAVFAAQLSTALDAYQTALPANAYRHLRVLKDQMLDSLRLGGIEVVNPVGKPFEEVSASVDVTGWRHHEDFASEVVAEVIEPIITYQGAVIRQGRVIMGAPPEQTGEGVDESCQQS